MRNAYNTLAGKSKGKGLFRTLMENSGKINLKGVKGEVWTGFICLRTGTKGGVL
jgi:hypothetical protein